MYEFRRVHLEQVDSTMLEAQRIIRMGLQDPVVITASSQTGGMGRGSRQWISPIGNLYWTAVIPIQQHWSPIYQTTILAAISVVEAIKRTSNQPIVSIKWPNDVLVRSKKVSGCLARSYEGFLIMGIGVNIDSYPADGVLFPATSLIENGIATTVSEFSDYLTAYFGQNVSKWIDSGLGFFIRDYSELLSGVGEPTRVRRDPNDENSVITGTHRGVTPEGFLILEVNGSQEILHMGDVLGI